jgi:uncharacterized membrane protein YjjB (DUF3815 family)
VIAWELLMQNSIWAGLAAVGFALLFNVPRRTLFGCTLAGALGYAVRSLLLELGLVGIETGTLLAATLVSVLGVVFGRVWRVPAVVFAVPGLIPFVPGSLAFRAVSDLLTLTTGAVSDDTLLMKAVVSTLKSILIVGAIAAGVAVPSLLLRRDRPMT